MAREDETVKEDGSFRHGLVREAELDQVVRLYRGVYAYPFMLATFGLTAEYRAEHQGFFWFSTVSILVAMGMRIALLVWRTHIDAIGTQRLHWLFIANVWLVSGCSGLLFATDLWFYGFESWTFTILMLCVVGMSSGGTISFTPSLGLLRLQVILLLGPALVCGLLLRTGQGNTYALATLALSAFLLWQGDRLNKVYWEQLRDRALKNMRARELETAKAAAEAASVAKSQFLANMSHEIRTPMHGILGMAQLAMARETPPDQSREYLRELRSCAEGLLHVLNDILDFSKIEAGRLSVERMPFSLLNLLDETRHVILPQSSAKGLALECRSDPGIPDLLLGDAARLRQVLINLLGNATKFTNAGSVTLEVTGVSPDKQGGAVQLLFRVSDTGIGIAREDQLRIFDAFAQADGSVTRQFGGTGLGLSICSQLVGLMGGRLWVESTPDVGSTFQFTCELGIGNQGDCRTAEPEVAVRPFQAMRILLADDHPISQLLAGKMLGIQGHQVTTVSTGVAAIEAWQSGEFDVILMDNHMPEMGGVEAVRGIREREVAAGRERTAVIALTASAMVGDRERFLAAGADDYLSKPFRAEELHATIQRVVASPGHQVALQEL